MTREQSRKWRRPDNWLTQVGMGLASFAALGLMACTGAVSGGSGPGSGEGTDRGAGPSQPGRGGNGSTTGNGDPLPPLDPNPTKPQVEACKTINPGPAPLRRLTRAEFDNTVRDLLGVDDKLGADFPEEARPFGFDNNAELNPVTGLLAEGYVAAAEKLATAAVAKLDSLLACDGSNEATCLDEFLDGFAQRAWRRPLSTEERDHLKRRFAELKGDKFADGIEGLIQILLLSPQFLYRLEQPVPIDGQAYGRLDHYAMASRLSYLLWNSMPDEALFQAAGGGKLGTRDEISTHAKRMLSDPKATAMVGRFAGQWLDLVRLADVEKDPETYPDFTTAHLDLFRQETEEFFQHVWKTDGKVSSLLTANFSFMNGPLASFYGISGANGDAFGKVDVPAERAGFLTQASFLAHYAKIDQSSPVHRGVAVQENLLCFHLPEPPPDIVDGTPVSLNPNMTTKERFAAHRNNPSCESCHRYIDPIGFGFENFDAVGRYRTMDAGKPVDASGQLTDTDVDGPFVGAAELAKRLGESQQVQNCVASKWFSFAFGREPNKDQDACTVATLNQAMEKSGGDLRELLLTITQTDTFLFTAAGGQ